MTGYGRDCLGEGRLLFDRGRIGAETVEYPVKYPREH